MKGKTKFGWALAIAILTLAIMAGSAAQSTWGAHPESRVHYYMIAFACSPDKMRCMQVPAEEFNTRAACDTHLRFIQENPDIFLIPGLPLVLGKCKSWFPPFSVKEQRS